MSLLTYNFESEYLNNNHQITVILPDKSVEYPRRVFMAVIKI